MIVPARMSDGRPGVVALPNESKLRVALRKVRRLVGSGEKFYFDPWYELTAARVLAERGFVVVEVRMTPRMYRTLRRQVPKIDATRARNGFGPLFSNALIERFEGCPA